MQETTLAEAKSRQNHSKVECAENVGSVSKNVGPEECDFIAYSVSRKDGVNHFMVECFFMAA